MQRKRYYIINHSSFHTPEILLNQRKLIGLEWPIYFNQRDTIKSECFRFKANSPKPKIVVTVATDDNCRFLPFACVCQCSTKLYRLIYLLKEHQVTRNSVTKSCFQLFMTFKQTKDDCFCFLLKLLIGGEKIVFFCVCVLGLIYMP